MKLFFNMQYISQINNMNETMFMLDIRAVVTFLGSHLVCYFSARSKIQTIWAKYLLFYRAGSLMIPFCQLIGYLWVVYDINLCSHKHSKKLQALHNKNVSSERIWHHCIFFVWTFVALVTNYNLYILRYLMEPFQNMTFIIHIRHTVILEYFTLKE